MTGKRRPGPTREQVRRITSFEAKDWDSPSTRYQPPLYIFASRVELGRIRLPAVLAGAGYAQAEVLDASMPLNRHAIESSALFIGLISKTTASRSALAKFIRAYEPSPLLGIVLGQPSDCELAVLQHCTDFVIWPCAENELVLRLQRFLDLLPPPPPPALPQAILAKFLRLNLIGRSPAFLEVLKTVRRIAGYNVAVSIYGETGTGKELVARAIHYLGSRASGPFLPVNCGSLPDTLLENELFGHERGAYTDAREEQLGLIAQAEGGTLFLDEIEALSPRAQVTLLRFLHDKQYRPLGSKVAKTADLRIIAASNVSLEQLRGQSKFRHDLFFRLNVMPLVLPPLRARPGDIPLLAQHFLQNFRACYEDTSKFLPPQTLRWMTQYNWPGNVRELENAIHRAFLLSDAAAIQLDHVRPEIGHAYEFDPAFSTYPSADLPFNAARAHVINAFEQNYLKELLRRTGGNITHAAKQAQKERRALGKLLKKHDLHGLDFKSS